MSLVSRQVIQGRVSNKKPNKQWKPPLRFEFKHTHTHTPAQPFTQIKYRNENIINKNTKLPNAPWTSQTNGLNNNNNNVTAASPTAGEDLLTAVPDSSDAAQQPHLTLSPKHSKEEQIRKRIIEENLKREKVSTATGNLSQKSKVQTLTTAAEAKTWQWKPLFSGHFEKTKSKKLFFFFFNQTSTCLYFHCWADWR